MDKKQVLTISTGENSCEAFLEDFSLGRVCCTRGQIFP
jgi:hypothetical protein